MATEQLLQDQILSKASSDQNFKEKLLVDPKAAIEEEFGIKVSDNMNIKVMEENKQTIYLVLPQNPSKAKTSNEPVNAPMWN